MNLIIDIDDSIDEKVNNLKNEISNIKNEKISLVLNKKDYYIRNKVSSELFFISKYLNIYFFNLFFLSYNIYYCIISIYFFHNPLFLVNFIMCFILLFRIYSIDYELLDFFVFYFTSMSLITLISSSIYFFNFLIGSILIYMLQTCIRKFSINYNRILEQNN